MTQAYNPSQHTYNYQQTPPAFAALVTVPSDVKNRMIFVSVSVTGGAVTASSLNAEVETGVGTGVYEIVSRWRSPMSASGHTAPGSFAVPGGRQYRFVEDEVGGTRSIAHYGFVDERGGGA